MAPFFDKLDRFHFRYKQLAEEKKVMHKVKRSSKTIITGKIDSIQPDQKTNGQKRARNADQQSGDSEASVSHPEHRRILMPKKRKKKRMLLCEEFAVAYRRSWEKQLEEDRELDFGNQIKKRRVNLDIIDPEANHDELNSSIQEAGYIPGNSQPMDWFPEQSPNSTFSKNLGTMLGKQKFGDVAFKFENDQDIRAYKGILAAQSSVFAAMFEQDENTENVLSKVEIVGFSRTVFQKMLHFIYTDNIPEFGEQTKDLLAIADKYQLKKLKFFCEMELVKTIAVDNAIILLEIAEKYCAQQLEKHVMKFVYENLNQVITSDRYCLIEQTNIHLMSSILRNIAARMIQTQ